MLTELKNRGLKDVFIAAVDSLSGFPDAIYTVYRDTRVQLWIVHMVRLSLKFVSWKHRKAVGADLKKIYTATTVAEVEREVAAFGERRDAQYPSISQSWRCTART